jgi:hypothetical protein
VDRIRVVDLVLEAKAGGSEATYTYRLEIDAKEGDALLAPLGNRTVMGFAMRVYETTEDALGFPLASLRTIDQRVDGLSMPPQLVSMVRYTADQG